MGREIRRVPLDFAHPIGQVWDGFVNPHYRECREHCHGGYSRAYLAIHEHVMRLMWDRAALEIPEVGAVTGWLAGRKPSGPFGHDSMDTWRATEKLGELAGLPKGWHTCPTCGGDSVDPDAQEAYEAWVPTDPPAGKGWQVWETVSEGSPVSPVFATATEVVEWLASEGYTRAGAERFVEGGWAPSMVFTPGVGMSSGIDALGDVPEEGR